MPGGPGAFGGDDPGDGLEGLIVGSAGIVHGIGGSQTPEMHLRRTAQALRDAGLVTRRIGRNSITVLGSADVYARILGAAPPYNGFYPLPEGNDALRPYVTGFEFVPPPSHFF